MTEPLSPISNYLDTGGGEVSAQASSVCVPPVYLHVVRENLNRPSRPSRGKIACENHFGVAIYVLIVLGDKRPSVNVVEHRLCVDPHNPPSSTRFATVE
jgi:hypothetical protein